MQKDTTEDISEEKQNRKILFAGPCVLSGYSESYEIAKKVKLDAEEHGFYPVFKASFDKANRTSSNGYRGMGIEASLEIFQSIKSNLGIEVITDVHESNQVDKISNTVDFLQVPAFLCRQTDLIEACAKSGKPTLVKKGQFLSPESVSFIEEKFYKAGGHKLIIGERGTTFGYNELIVDATSIIRMKQSCPNSLIIMDCTHSLQLPNSSTGKTGGRSHLVETMVKYGSVMNSDGLFIEVHPVPSQSPSDSDNILLLSQLNRILKISKKIYDTVSLD
jgi:2-dehydro-3-deoxyphosphooctonate aldolase (KDO 8-P synthase)